MASRRQAVEPKRRIPRQARAAATIDAILDGAAQILEAGGLPAFTTNAVAERAGVSIGTLYQYFADKNALLRRLAEREMQAGLANIARGLAGEVDPTPEGRVRAMIRAMINAFGGRQRARKAVMQAVMAQGIDREVLAPAMAFIAQVGAQVGHGEQRLFAALSREQIFVLSRALMGVVRSAVREEQPFLRSRTFEDEMVRLVLAYLGAVTDSPGARHSSGAS